MTEVTPEIPNGMPSNGQHNVTSADEETDEPKVSEVAKEGDDVECSAESEGESDDSHESSDSGAMDESSSRVVVEGKRQRKQVQRLSETLNRVYETEVEKQASISKKMLTTFESGKGVGLGSIPLIEATLTKTKAVELKPLHAMIFGRSGTLNEVKGNIRRFHGFAFEADSSEYKKRLGSISQRAVSEIREALRILHLEVSGTREQIVQRLMTFLLKPTTEVVKYKGKLVRKSNRGRPRKSDLAGGTPGTAMKVKTKSRLNSKHKATASMTTSDSRDEISHDDSEEDVDSEDSLPSVEEPASPPPPAKGKRGRKPGSLNSTKRSKVVTGDDLPAKPVIQDDSQDEDVPLTALAGKTNRQQQPAPPTDEDLSGRVIKLLQTVNLEETSLKVVREQIFACYPGIDLSEKKGFINATVKEYLSKS